MKLILTNLPPEGMNPEKIRGSVENVFLKMEAAAKENLSDVHVPPATGQLRMSIESHAVIDGSKIIGEVGSNVDYAPFVEYGTGLYASPLGPGSSAQSIPWNGGNFGQRPKLYLTRAWQQYGGELRDVIKKAMTDND